jgi:hypothetical protein
VKFSEIERQAWEQLKPYLDTCLLPVTGLNGAEEPWEATRKLESLQRALDGLEKPYRGRVVTYPAAHYIANGDGQKAALGEICRRLKQAGFRYVVIVSVCRELEGSGIEGADAVAVMDPEATPDACKDFHRTLSRRIEALWREGAQTADGN